MLCGKLVGGAELTMWSWKTGRRKGCETLTSSSPPSLMSPLTDDGGLEFCDRPISSIVPAGTDTVVVKKPHSGSMCYVQAVMSCKSPYGLPSRPPHACTQGG